MPKIRDLGISIIPNAQAGNRDPGAPKYWMCNPTDPNDPEGFPDDECRPTRPPCHPSKKEREEEPECAKTVPIKPENGGKKTRGLPHAAVMQLRQQLHQEIGRQLQ